MTLVEAIQNLVAAGMDREAAIEIAGNLIREAEITALRARLDHSHRDITGQRLQHQIANIQPGNDATAVWISWREAPERVTLACPRPPSIGQHLIKVSTLEDPWEVLLVYFAPDSKPECFCIVPHPLAEKGSHT